MWTTKETILPGFGLEEYSFLTAENGDTYAWPWHVNFYYAVPGTGSEKCP